MNPSASVRRLRNVFRRRVAEDIAEEFHFHMEAAAEEAIRDGTDPNVARARARRAFGNVLAIRETSREVMAMVWLESVWQDVKLAMRVLRKNPGFTLAAAVTLALGIGANTAIFSVVYGVLLRPLPYGDGERLVVLHQYAKSANVSDFPFSVKELEDYRAQNHTLDAVVEHHTMNFLLLTGDSAERVNTAVVSANFFDVLGVRAAQGRTFVPRDEDAGSDAVLILSDAYWKSRFGGDPSVVGRVFQMNNRPHTVIGVLPPIPQYPVENDVYMPTSQCPTRSSAAFKGNRGARMMTAFGKLKPGVSIEQAQADLSSVSANMARAYPEAYPSGYGYGMSVASLRKDLTQRAETLFLVLLGAAGFVLLIACANVANLLLARLLKMDREISVRLALGAGRGRIVRQLLTESLILSCAGGLMGLAIAPPILSALTAVAKGITTRAAEVQIDLPVLAFTTALAFLTGIIFGVGPAFFTGTTTGSSIRDGARATESGTRRRLRSALIVAQVAFSFLLLAGAGLMLRSFSTLIKVDAGFDSSRLLTMRLSTNFTKYDTLEAASLLNERVIREVETAVGVEGAALATNFPFNRGGIARGPNQAELDLEGETRDPKYPAHIVDVASVSDGYFAAIRQPIVEGRGFTPRDRPDTPLVAVVNRTMANHRWPGASPVGKRLKFGRGDGWIEVVGVVGDVREYGLDKAAGEEVYLPLLQKVSNGNLVVRTSADAANLLPAVREAIRKVDPQIAIDRVATMEVLREESLTTPRVTTLLMGVFAALAVLIAAGGIGAVMALSVSQRTNELGVRMALGASKASIVGLVTRGGMLLALLGVLVGIAGAASLSRFLSTLLYATSPTDITTFSAVALLFLLVATLACLIPARGVTSIDPACALRRE